MREDQREMGDDDEGGDFVGTICSICYEDLKPIVEDLQSITICGHVFHELCLQQWFEYCSKAKKCTCPVCKQICRASDVARLYFQSVGDVKDSLHPKKCEEEDARVLRREVKRLEVKISALSSTVDRQGKELGDITEELCACKKQAKLDLELKNEALKQKEIIERQLFMKSEVLQKSTLECSKLKDRNMALAKELAALKLVSDLDLDEDDVLKLAWLGNSANSQDVIDTLRRSLVMRNRSYKELMTKCNILGRGEARYSHNLEKANEKIKKLKARVQELEAAAELKENEILRSLKVSKKTSCLKDLQNNIGYDSVLFSADKVSSNKHGKQILTSQSRLDQNVDVNNKSSQYPMTENINGKEIKETKDVNCSKESLTTMSRSGHKDCILVDEDDSEHAKYICKDQNSDTVALGRSTLAKSEAASGVNRGKYNLAEPISVDVNNEFGNIAAGNTDEDVTCLDDLKLVQPMINIQKENPLPIALSSPGDISFSGGLLGPDGTNRYLGKWCKRGQNKESVGTNGSSNGDLIAVGADGRGGKIKVLRPPSQTFLDSKEKSLGSKRLKSGPKASNTQSQGSLQIEHFFGRVRH